MTRAEVLAPRLAGLGRSLVAHWPPLALWAAMGLGLLAIEKTSQFSRDHALMINASPSLPYWAIWLDRMGTPARGDLVVFMPPRSDLVTRHFGARPLPFGKRVLGMAGDKVTEQNRQFFVNGHPVALAKTASRLGEPLALGPIGTIPKDCYFVATEHKDGLDSRYAAIGWVCKPQLLGVGRAVL